MKLLKKWKAVMRVEAKGYHRAWDFEDARSLFSRAFEWLDGHLELIALAFGCACVLGFAVYLIVWT